MALPGRAIEAALLYTAGPSLFAIDAATLEANKPGFAAREAGMRALTVIPGRADSGAVVEMPEPPASDGPPRGPSRPPPCVR